MKSKLDAEAIVLSNFYFELHAYGILLNSYVLTLLTITTRVQLRLNNVL